MDENTQVFIVRLWQEPREIPGASKLWRGVVEHVPSGNRRYFDRLITLFAYLLAFGKSDGMRAGPCLQSCLGLCLRIDRLGDHVAPR